MNAPAYRWTCLNCAAANPPEQNECAACGFPAEASGADLAAFRAGKPLPARRPLPVRVARQTIPLLRHFMILLWLLAVAAFFLTLWLTAEYGRGYGGPGGWGSGILLIPIGWLLLTPSLFLGGLFCMLAEGARKKERSSAAAIYGALASFFALLAIPLTWLLFAVV